MFLKRIRDQWRAVIETVPIGVVSLRALVAGTGGRVGWSR
jgi:hypothetical protein